MLWVAAWQAATQIGVQHEGRVQHANAFAEAVHLTHCKAYPLGKLGVILLQSPNEYLWKECSCMHS